MGTQLFRRLLIAIDGSENSVKAAKLGIKIAEQNHAKVHILYIIDSNLIEDLIRVQKSPRAEVLEQQKKKAKIYMEDLGSLCEKRNVPHLQIIQEGQVTNSILNFIETYNIDLLVIAHHSQIGTGRMRMGTVCAGVIEFATCPVLVYREKAR
ncbi:MAG: universal stress protein [Candidatus Helarchaeota archaeon]